MSKKVSFGKVYTLGPNDWDTRYIAKSYKK